MFGKYPRAYRKVLPSQMKGTLGGEDGEIKFVNPSFERRQPLGNLKARGEENEFLVQFS